MKKSDILLEINELNTSTFKSISKRFRELGLDITPVHGRIIMALYESKRQLCQKDIEEVVLCNKSTLSSILNTMEKNNLIKRVEDEVDSRKKKLVLTEKSLKIIGILKEDTEKIGVILTSGITSDEINNFKKVVEKIKNNIERL